MIEEPNDHGDESPEVLFLTSVTYRYLVSAIDAVSEVVEQKAARRSMHVGKSVEQNVQAYLQPFAILLVDERRDQPERELRTRGVSLVVCALRDLQDRLEGAGADARQREHEASGVRKSRHAGTHHPEELAPDRKDAPGARGQGEALADLQVELGGGPHETVGQAGYPNESVLIESRHRPRDRKTSGRVGLAREAADPLRVPPFLHVTAPRRDEGGRRRLDQLADRITACVRLRAAEVAPHDPVAGPGAQRRRATGATRFIPRAVNLQATIPRSELVSAPSISKHPLRVPEVAVGNVDSKVHPCSSAVRRTPGLPGASGPTGRKPRIEDVLSVRPRDGLEALRPRSVELIGQGDHRWVALRMRCA